MISEPFDTCRVNYCIHIHTHILTSQNKKRTLFVFFCFFLFCTLYLISERRRLPAARLFTSIVVILIRSKIKNYRRNYSSTLTYNKTVPNAHTHKYSLTHTETQIIYVSQLLEKNFPVSKSRYKYVRGGIGFGFLNSRKWHKWLLIQSSLISGKLSKFHTKFSDYNIFLWVWWLYL